MFSQPHHNIEYLDIHPGMSVLDCGVGAGDYAHFLAQRVGEKGTLYLVDIQKKLLQKVESDLEERNITHIKTLWTDLDDPKGLEGLPSESIDRILIANLLFQLEHPARIFAECHRALRKGGLILCIDWKDSFGHIGPHPQAIVHPDTARAHASRTGFQIRKESLDVGPHHYGFLAQK